MDFNKIKEMGLEYAEKGRTAALDLAQKSKIQAKIVSEQSKLLKAQRQLGALVYAELGQLREVNAFKAEALCLKVDGDEDTGEVQHRRENGAQGDLTIGDVHVLGHEEGGGAHDRRHYLTAGGGGGLNRGGKLWLVTGLLHHRDGDGAGGDGVADGGAGHHAAQGRGDDRDLRRAAGKAADKRVCNVDKESGNACALKEGAEDDKDDDELCADLHRGGHDAAGGIEERVDNALHADADGKGIN